MSTFSYRQSKVIDEVSFKKSANGAIRGYLHAHPDAGLDTIQNIMDTLKKKDFEYIPFTLAGKPVIEVRGFKRESDLIMLLDENKWIHDKPEVTKDKEDDLSWKDKLKKRSLQAAGGLYSVGDAGFIAYGWKDSSPLDMAAGVLYALPTPVLMAYGRNDQSQLQIKDFAKKMAKEFKAEVAKLPEDCSLQALTADHKKGLLQNTGELLQRYPSEFMNLCYAGAGACIAIAAGMHLKSLSTNGVPAKTVEGWLSHLQKTQPNITKEVASNMALKNVRLENWLNAGVGCMSVASGLFGTLVREKARDPDAPKKTGLTGLWEWVRERPLTIAGAGLMVSTMLHAAATAVAVKGQDPKHKKAVPFRVLFVVSALMAEMMVAISSKGHGDGVVSDKSVDNSAVAIAADLIVKQPKALQNHLIEEMGKFIGREDVLAMKDEEAIDLLRKQVEFMRGNPWTKAEGMTTKPAAALFPAVKPVIPAWQAKIAVPEPSLAQLQPPS